MFCRCTICLVISECVTSDLKELEQSKTFIKYKKATADKFITKKTQVSSVECRDHCDEIKTIS